MHTFTVLVFICINLAKATIKCPVDRDLYGKTSLNVEEISFGDKTVPDLSLDKFRICYYLNMPVFVEVNHAGTWSGVVTESATYNLSECAIDNSCSGSSSYQCLQDVSNCRASASFVCYVVNSGGTPFYI